MLSKAVMLRSSRRFMSSPSTSISHSIRSVHHRTLHTRSFRLASPPTPLYNNYDNNNNITATQQRYTLQNPPPPVEEAWQPVRDNSGGVYWWNSVSDETTHVGAPKPVTFYLPPPLPPTSLPPSPSPSPSSYFSSSSSASPAPVPSTGSSSVTSVLLTNMAFGAGTAVAFGLLFRMFS